MVVAPVEAKLSKSKNALSLAALVLVVRFSFRLTSRGAQRRQLGQDGNSVRHQARAFVWQPLRFQRSMTG